VKTCVTDFLDTLNIPYQVKFHERPVFTSEDAARERGVRLSQIVKTMLLVGREDTIVVAVVPGHKRLDLKKLKKLSGHKGLQFMDKEVIEKKMGLVVGAMAPIVEGFPVFVDRSVFDQEVVDISSGDPKAGLELRREDLRRLLTHAIVAEIAKEG
jgi:Cys-tRNA(Pro) deacylase